MLKTISSLFRDLAGLDNVIGLGRGHKWTRNTNTGQEALVVLVKNKYKKSDLKRSALIPIKIDDVPTDVIEVGDIKLLNGRTQFLRPAQPGLSIGHYKVSAGTFGAVVRDRASGELLMLSNNHVMANLTDGLDGRAVIGDPILQPGLYDGGDKDTALIAHLSRYVPLYKDVAASRCKIAKLFETVLNKCISVMRPQYHIRVFRQNEKVNLVDCAVATPVEPSAISAEILELGTVHGIKEPQIGMMVKKSGRSTGVTSSMVLVTDATLKVYISNTEYGIFEDQVVAGPMSMPGDSGSLIITQEEEKNFAVGLLFAGSEQVTLFNKIDNVLDALHVTF